MMRILPRSFRAAARPLPRAARLYQSVASRPVPPTASSSQLKDATPSRSYATETSIPPSANDMFANGTNAFYADE